MTLCTAPMESVYLTGQPAGNVQDGGGRHLWVSHDVGAYFVGTDRLVCGFILGFVLDLLISKDRKVRKKMGGKRSEVVLMIRCDENDAPAVEKILSQNFAIGLGRLHLSSSSGMEVLANHAGRS